MKSLRVRRGLSLDTEILVIAFCLAWLRPLYSETRFRILKTVAAHFDYTVSR